MLERDPGRLRLERMRTKIRMANYKIMIANYILLSKYVEEEEEEEELKRMKTKITITKYKTTMTNCTPVVVLGRFLRLKWSDRCG